MSRHLSAVPDLSEHDRGECDPRACLDAAHLFDAFRPETLGALLDVIDGPA